MCIISALKTKSSNIGYCTEYNTMGKVIQEHYGAECTNHDLPCPVLYNSAESYKCKLKRWLFKMF